MSITTQHPLNGVRVVEFCHVAAGPYCAMLLADFDAIVNPQADHLQLEPDQPLPSGRISKTVACPVWLDGAPVPMRTTLPLLGEPFAAAETATAKLN